MNGDALDRVIGARQDHHHAASALASYRDGVRERPGTFDVLMYLQFVHHASSAFLAYVHALAAANVRDCTCGAFIEDIDVCPLCGDERPPEGPEL